MIYLEAVFIGLSLSILIGPLLLTILDTSINYGVREGFYTISGMWISDVLIACTSLLFLTELHDFIRTKNMEMYLGLTGSVILIALGILVLYRPVKVISKERIIEKPSYLTFLTKGFLVNTINPFTFIFWIGIVTTYLISRSRSTYEVALILLIILFMIMTTDTIKVILANKIKAQISTQSLHTFNKVIGALLIVFGLLLIYRVII